VGYTGVPITVTLIITVTPTITVSATGDITTGTGITTMDGDIMIGTMDGAITTGMDLMEVASGASMVAEMVRVLGEVGRTATIKRAMGQACALLPSC
jgi:hypothetical protein